MNIGNLNVSQASERNEEQAQVLASDFTPPYHAFDLNEDGSLNTDSAVDVISRMFYSRRALSARPIDEQVIEGIDMRVLNRFISSTGSADNIARKAKYAVRLFFNFANSGGDLITREVPVSIVKASYIFDVVVADDGSMKPEFIGLEEYLVRHGFLKKGALSKKSDSAKVAVPLVADLNSCRMSLSGQNYVCKLAATGYIDSGKSDGNSFRVDLRVAETNIKVGDMENAIKAVIDGEEIRVRQGALSFVKTAVLFALSMSENLRVFQGEQEGYLPRDLFRMFGVQVAECYYGKAEFSSKESNYGFHALVAGVFDLATLGGAWETVPANRVVAGDGWVIPVLNQLNR